MCSSDLKQPTSVPELDTPGSMIIFNSYILHKVNPVLNGIRKTLSIFIQEPAFKRIYLIIIGILVVF